ncbi:hypothetical protein [Propionivibrio sp.]|uniref:hypothetical protein n=1 Tax=Propionivibrio sp. TaxID=2212460 RepID=UPI0039E59A06
MRCPFHPLLAVLLLAAGPPLRAQPADAAPVPQTLEQAAAQRQRAEAMRQDAERRYAADEAACYRKILVNDCLKEAKERYTNTIVGARRLEAPAREFERESRRGEIEAEKDRRAAERPAREAEQQERAERYRADEAAKAAAREEKRLDKERKAEENRRKSAEEQAKRQVKEEKRAQKQAAQIEKKARERAKAEQKAAEKAARENQGGSPLPPPAAGTGKEP